MEYVITCFENCFLWILNDSSYNVKSKKQSDDELESSVEIKVDPVLETVVDILKDESDEFELVS